MLGEMEKSHTRLRLSAADRIERRGLMAALDAAQCLVWLDAESHVVDANANAQNLLEMGSDDLLRCSLADLIGGRGGHEDYHRRHWIRIRDGLLKAEERSVYRPDGTELWCSISYAAIKSECGKTRRVLAIIIDLAPWSWRPKNADKAG